MPTQAVPPIPNNINIRTSLKIWYRVIPLFRRPAAVGVDCFVKLFHDFYIFVYFVDSEVGRQPALTMSANTTYEM